MRHTIVLAFFAWMLCDPAMYAQNIHRDVNSEEVTIVLPHHSQSFMFTNSIGMFYCGESGSSNTASFHGLSFLTHEFLEDYIIEVNGTPLVRSQAEAHIYQDKLIRFYSDPKVEEEISISDSLPLLIVKITSSQKAPLSVIPIISGSKKQQDFVNYWSTTDKILYIARKNHLVRNDDNNYPVWIGISTYPGGEYTLTGMEALKNISHFTDEKIYIPGKINIYLEKKAYLFFIIGDSKKEVLRLRNQYLKNLNIEIKKPKPQIDGIRKA